MEFFWKKGRESQQVPATGLRCTEQLRAVFQSLRSQQSAIFSSKKPGISLNEIQESTIWNCFWFPERIENHSEKTWTEHLYSDNPWIKYRKIPNISPGLINVRKHFLGGLYSRGAYIRGAYIRRAFCVSVRVSRHRNSLLYIAIICKKAVCLGQNYLYFALKPI